MMNKEEKSHKNTKSSRKYRSINNVEEKKFFFIFLILIFNKRYRLNKKPVKLHRRFCSVLTPKINIKLTHCISIPKQKKNTKINYEFINTLRAHVIKTEKRIKITKITQNDEEL